jgi:ATP-dependent Clp protease ATP-binding subunit ClpA
MFERFTDRARRVVVLAQEEARLLNHNYIGTEHILLGLLHEGDGVAAKALATMGISLESVRSQVEQIIGTGGSSPSGHIPFTPRSKKVLELALREALQLGHNYIGTEHILLGLIREGEGVACQVLSVLGADLTRTRMAVVKLLKGAPLDPVSGPSTAVTTPGARRAEQTAKFLAGPGPIGTHHLLLGFLDDTDSLAARVLTSLGVTRTSVEHLVAELGREGTSDELPEEVGGRKVGVRLDGEKVVVEVDDPEVAEQFRQALDQPGVDPATSYGAIWRVVRDVARTLAPATEAEPSSEAQKKRRWRKPDEG